MFAHTIRGYQDKKAAEARHETAEQLRAVKELPRDVIERFERDGVLDEAVVSQLPQGPRDRVRFTYGLYATDPDTRRYEAIGSASLVELGWCGFLAAFLVGVPAVILGLSLILRKPVWKCSHCGYFYQRA